MGEWSRRRFDITPSTTLGLGQGKICYECKQYSFLFMQEIYHVLQHRQPLARMDRREARHVGSIRFTLRYYRYPVPARATCERPSQRRSLFAFASGMPATTARKKSEPRSR